MRLGLMAFPVSWFVVLCVLITACGQSEVAPPPLDPVVSGQGNSVTPRAANKEVNNQKKQSVDKLPDLSFGKPPSPPRLPDPDLALDDSNGAKPTPGNQPDSSELDANQQHDDGFEPQRRLGPETLVEVNRERVEAAGLQWSESQHLILIHEPSLAEELSDWGEVFDQAVEQWVDFFQASPGRFADWQVTCFHVLDRAKFDKAGLYPPASELPGDELPPGGWAYGNQVWLNQHPGTYYNRHQLLHEGTHCFCYYNYGTLGPPWLAEGLAEYLALHRWQDGQLEMAARVSNKEEIEYWGRVKLVQDAWFDGQPLALDQVLALKPADFPATESYAWSWVAVSLFANHPQLKHEFHQVLQDLPRQNVASWNQQLLRAVPLDAEQLEVQWQVDVSEMQYGFDFEKTAIQWTNVDANLSQPWKMNVPADGAWHQSPFELSAGVWKMTVTGQFRITDEGQPVISGPDGISLAYAQGARLGMVQCAVPGENGLLKRSSSLTRPMNAGSEFELTIAQPRQVFFRVNDDPSQLGDNQGQVTVELKKQD